MPLQLPVNIKPGSMTPNPDAKKRIKWFIHVSPELSKKLNQEPNGPHIKMMSQGGKIVLLVSEYLKQALEDRQRGRTSRDTEIYKNKLLKRSQEIYSSPNDNLFIASLKKSLEGTKPKETPFGTMYQSGLIITKSKKNGNMWAQNPSAPWHLYDKDALDPILENEIRLLIRKCIQESFKKKS